MSVEKQLEELNRNLVALIDSVDKHKRVTVATTFIGDPIQDVLRQTDELIDSLEKPF